MVAVVAPDIALADLEALLLRLDLLFLLPGERDGDGLGGSEGEGEVEDLGQ